MATRRSVFIRSMGQAKRLGIAEPFRDLVGAVVIPTNIPKVVAYAGSHPLAQPRIFRPRGKYTMGKMSRYMDGQRFYYYATSKEAVNILLRSLFGKAIPTSRT